jgi:mono/diheme cytochrome c family protein
MAEREVRRMRPGRWGALALVALVGAGCTPLDDVMVAVFGRSMRDQSSIQPYQNPRLPAEGSVPFASGNFPGAVGEFGIGQAEGTAIPEPVTPLMVLQAGGNPEAIPQVNALVNPVSADARSLARGEELFNRACAPCHAQDGGGQGTVTAAGIPPWPVVSDQASAYTDGYLYSIIRVGRGLMPAYGHQLSHHDRWHVVNYLRRLQGAAPTQAGGAPPGDTGAEGDSPDA